MKGLATTIALALLVLGCGPAAAEVGQGVPVQLLTGDYQGLPPIGAGGCFTNSGSGALIADPSRGTALMDEDMVTTTHQTAVPVPVMWRPGFTAVRVGSDVTVRDTAGNVVAVTGREYRIEGTYDGHGSFWACGNVTQLP